MNRSFQTLAQHTVTSSLLSTVEPFLSQVSKPKVTGTGKSCPLLHPNPNEILIHCLVGRSIPGEAAEFKAAEELLTRSLSDQTVLRHLLGSIYLNMPVRSELLPHLPGCFFFTR